MSLLSLRNLSVDIHQESILQDVNLELAAGEVCGVIGESGSGKSMTALGIMGLLPHGSRCHGEVEFDGTLINHLTDSELCKIRGKEIGMIFQEPMTALNPVHTIGEQVTESILLHTELNRSDATQLAAETLERCGLRRNTIPLHRYPHELSGGQRQRVVIAIAVALKPKLLIADEPTTALDVTTQREILELLRELQQSSGMTMILISHDLAVVANVADNVIIMKNGNVVEYGKTSALFQAPQHDYTKKLIAASNHIPHRIVLPWDSTEINSAKKLLTVSNLVCEYPLPRRSLFSRAPVFRAVDNVSFHIYPGENVGLVGESGCGKSTLTRALLGLMPVASGNAYLEDKLLSGEKRLNKHTRKNIQVVFQDPYSSFNPRHRVRRLVAEPLYAEGKSISSREKNKRVEEALESVGLDTADAEKYIHEFSGGQRQRIAIARALIIRPKLIILDEAVSALDVSIRAQVLDLLAELGNTLKLSFLFISHDLSVVKNVTDRVLVMHQGRIVESAETEILFTAPKQDYTRRLLAAVPKLVTQLSSTAN
ncbi:MAG: ABC transporter ATP-binding protein [Acidiferrobacterales bacterium]|nr:ABC transporter ATP-binding protein [Acidiferrobacterales bacterium]